MNLQSALRVNKLAFCQAKGGGEFHDAGLRSHMLEKKKMFKNCYVEKSQIILSYLQLNTK